MTLTHTQKTKKSGMTLIELTVVILVLLSLISILFVGARAWKRGSDRAGCIMNIRNVQQGVRSYQNMNEYSPLDAYTGTAADITAEVIGASLFVEVAPTCPGPGTYGYPNGTASFPDVGILYMTCDQAGNLNHEPAAHADW